MLYALSEFQSGSARTIRVTAKGTAFSVADDGRGHSIDKTVEGTSYLKFIYQHFDYPFESGGAAPIQLQGIGMSLINAMCSELVMIVGKRDDTLQMWFCQGQPHRNERTAVLSEVTGVTISAEIHSQLQSTAVDTVQLEEWLLSLLIPHPTLTLFFNGQQLHAPPQSGAQQLAQPERLRHLPPPAGSLP